MLITGGRALAKGGTSEHCRLCSVAIPPALSPRFHDPAAPRTIVLPHRPHAPKHRAASTIPSRIGIIPFQVRASL